MLKRYRAPFILSIVVLAFSSLIFAQENKTFDSELIKEVQGSFKPDAKDIALINAVTNNSVKELALNRKLVNSHNDFYDVEVDAKGITNQKRTGRCWMFAATNIMRPVVMEKFKLSSFKFSLAYLFFWDKMDKANYFLEKIIETADRDVDDRELQAFLGTPIPDGGWWNYAVNLINKYGVVPSEIMPETENTSKSGSINKIFDNYSRNCAVELRGMVKDGKDTDELRERKVEMLKEYYRVLVMHFGCPPEKFTWIYKNKEDKIVEKEYTPVEFYKEAVGLNLYDYVSVVDYPSFPYNEHYKINMCTNMIETPDWDFINVSTEKLKKYALKALKDKQPVWFSADAGWQMEREHGIMAGNIYDYEHLYGIKDNLSKADRIKYKASVANHAMVFVAADTEDDKVLKWKVENSWGTDIGNSGYWAMYDCWFDKYVFNVIIDKKYIDEEDLKILDKDPKTIPAWDPLRSAMFNN